MRWNKTEDNVRNQKKASASKMIESMSISCDMLSFNTYGERKEKRKQNIQVIIILNRINRKNLVILKMSTNNALHFI